ncbi:probable serine/threonine-protein kinase PBL3 [Cynara cardunculus var. scolymus]|uniref:probable serine/threonine-protein kinase PBL3 n=1 Tax=Cynara cardunculus var. scolymus TaxID=59895 RepID=UPI000D627432|nr:probable serine/threonine-protein kinase PBL3 [Cynara cardunculus var. scolymus]
MGNAKSKLNLKAHVKPSSENPLGEEDLYEINVFHPHRIHRFCYKVLKTATGKFCNENLAGQGGCGDVYKGWLDYRTNEAVKPGHGFPVGVKKIKKEGAQGLEEWRNELKILSSFHHPNVVKLLGYCADGPHRMLVFEFIPMGSLEATLSRECSTELNWIKRIKIAKGLARGLEYLHTMDRPVIHRDIKSANILLDDDFNPKIADFGISRFGPQGDKTHLSTRVLGSKGYFAPEYIGTGHLTLKTDVYSLGVVLLEILTGLRAVKRYPNGVLRELSRWARPYLNDRKGLHCVIDKRVVKNLDIEEAYEFATIILQCLTEDPRKRPTITQVLNSLEQLEQNMNRWNHTFHNRNALRKPYQIL